MPRGGARPNSGPKKGYKSAAPVEKPQVTFELPPSPKLTLNPLPDPNIAIAVANAQRAIEMTTRRKRTPLELLYKVMENSKIDWNTRVRAMGLAAEYVHAKQPQAVHITAEVRLEAVIVEVETVPAGMVRPWEKQLLPGGEAQGNPEAIEAPKSLP